MNNPTALVVDDHPYDRRLARDVLRRMGWDVHEAADGAQAVEALRTFTPDLVVCDVVMPVVGGYELVQHLRRQSNTEHIPVVMCSAYFDETDKPESQLGATSFLAKPLDLARFRDAVTRAAQDRRGRPGRREHDAEQSALRSLNGKLYTKIVELETVAAQRRMLLAREMEATDRTRRAVAADLHDDTLQAITVAVLDLHDAATHCDTAQRDRIAHSADALQAAADRVRQAVFRLQPPEMAFGSVRRVLDATARAASAGTPWQISVSSTVAHEPSRDEVSVIHRIVHEALHNVRKHARARHLAISIDECDGGYRVRVVDDGVGVSADAHVPRPGHLGLAAMRERAEAAGGWWRIATDPGRGTTVEFWIPTAEAAAGGEAPPGQGSKR